MLFESPRLRGVREHLERAQFFFDLAEKEKDPKARYRLMLAAVYSCRAITEVMLEAIVQEEVKNLKDPNPKVNRDTFESQVAYKLPYYDLLERIRIHDFHRFGILPPDPNFRRVMFGGPIKMTAQGGEADITVTDQGPQVSITGGSHVKLKRPLLTQDDIFFDESSSKYVKLEVVLKDFLVVAPDVVVEFEKLIA